MRLGTACEKAKSYCTRKMPSQAQLSAGAIYLVEKEKKKEEEEGGRDNSR